MQSLPRLDPGGPQAFGAPVASPDPAHALLSGYGRFDSLRLARPGRVLLLDVGAPEADGLVYGLVVHAALADRETLVADGGNWLDAYRLGEAAERAGLPREAAEERVRVARGFTVHQLQTIVEEGLPRETARAGAGVGLLLVPLMTRLYLDEDVERHEARVLLGRALGALRRLAGHCGVPAVVTNDSLRPGRPHLLRRALDEGVHDAAALLPAPGGAMRLSAQGRVLLEPGPRSRQRRLTDYGAGLDAARGPPGRFLPPVASAIQYLPKRAGEMKAVARARAPA